MQKVRPGDPLKIAAHDWNEIADTVKIVRSLNRTGGEGIAAGYGDGIIRVQNLGDAVIGIYTVVQLTSHAPAMNYDNATTKNSPDYYTGVLPISASAPYAVTQEAIEPGAIGRAMVYGISPVKFSEVIEGAFADPSTTAQGQMLPSASGSARILSAPTTSNPWGVVLLGGGGGGGASEDPELLPWQILNTENGLYVVSPEWTLNAPYEEYPEGATPPAPEYAQGFDTTVNPDFAEEIYGAQCYLVGDSVCITDGSSDITTTYTRIYACMTSSGAAWGLGLAKESTAFTEGPCCILIARIARDAEGNITGVTQVRKGPIRSVWLETERFYIVSESSGDKRYAQAPLGLAEGTVVPSFSYWKLQTSIAGEILAVSEDLNYTSAAVFPTPQIALPYDTYIYRFNLHYDSALRGLIADAVTTPVIYSEVVQFAQFIAQPFVERVQVVYPDTPLDQGSVDSVDKTVQILAAMEGVVDVGTTNLFKTETVDVSETSTHTGV